MLGFKTSNIYEGFGESLSEVEIFNFATFDIHSRVDQHFHRIQVHVYDI